jgi:hypothetical protein
MQTLSGHFDGKVVILDEPVNLAPNTKVTVIAPRSGEIEKALVSDFASASAPAFERIWDNPLDADYDRL